MIQTSALTSGKIHQIAVVSNTCKDYTFTYWALLQDSTVMNAFPRGNSETEYMNRKWPDLIEKPSFDPQPAATCSGTPSLSGSWPTADPWHSQDGWDVSAQQRQLWLDFLYISSCMHVFAITRWWDFWALVFQVHWSAEFQCNCTKWFLGHRTKVPYNPSMAYFSYLLGD